MFSIILVLFGLVIGAALVIGLIIWSWFDSLKSGFWS